MADLSLPYLTGREALRQRWLDPETYATTLLLLYGDAVYFSAETKEEAAKAFSEWDPETIIREVMDDFDVVPHPVCKDKLLAAICVMSTDGFFQDLPTFINICNVLSGSTLDPTVFDPADPYECAWGITEAVLIGQPEDKENPFSQDILRYLRKACEDEGILNPPDVLALGGRPRIDFPYPDDAEALQDFLRTSSERSESVKRSLRQSLWELTHQIAQLELRTGSIDKIKSILETRIRTKSP